MNNQYVYKKLTIEFSTTKSKQSRWAKPRQIQNNVV